MDSVTFLNVEYVYLRIVDFFQNFDLVAILNWIIHYINLIKPFAVIFSLFVFFVIIYARMRLKQIGKEEKEKFEARKAALNAPAAHESHDEDLGKRWQQVMTHINSNNPSDWRLAILEADIMLADVLEKQGYQGDSIGDKLKGVEKGDFLTIEQAWTAHKVRNQIAHQGTDYQLNEREAKQTIDLYKQVFSEFYHI
ncbi:MAG TPA: hypothetical protein VHD69_00410 [Candidatus Paceibacterota bacterium]|nr:hypothetical protein [Candidatus Paceibacterota bacterium]